MMTQPSSLIANLRKQDASPIIYGHRGARGEMPENTMQGFQHLADLGIPAVELDVRNAANGVPVVFHDAQITPALARDNDGSWLETSGPVIAHSTLKALQSYNLGASKPRSSIRQRFPNQITLDKAHIPSLAEFCAWATTQQQLFLNVEIKSSPLEPELGDSPRVLAQAVIEQLRRHALDARVLISSFDWRILSACHEVAPNIPRGYLTDIGTTNDGDPPNIFKGSQWMDGLSHAAYEYSLPHVIHTAGGSVWAPYFKDITAHDVDEAHALGLLVNVWTVNTANDIRRMASMGVDGIITDYPTRAKMLLAQINPNNKKHA